MNFIGADEFRQTMAERLLARERFLRRKAAEKLDACPDKILTMANEAKTCAEIILGLAPDYVAPHEPDMRLARARHKGNSGGAQ